MALRARKSRPLMPAARGPIRWFPLIPQKSLSSRRTPITEIRRCRSSTASFGSRWWKTALVRRCCIRVKRSSSSPCLMNRSLSLRGIRSSVLKRCLPSCSAISRSIRPLNLSMTFACVRRSTMPSTRRRSAKWPLQATPYLPRRSIRQRFPAH